MIKIDVLSMAGFEAAFHAMRNPMNSWDKSDSNFDTKLDIGPNDMNLAIKLAKGGPVHAKYRRMIMVWADITAPLYWWKQFDTYKVGTTASSCSTMHKIHDKEFTTEDFSCEHLYHRPEFEGEPISWVIDDELNGKWVAEDTCPVVMFADPDDPSTIFPYGVLTLTIEMLNRCRDLYLKTHDKRYWWQMIQLLPSTYNQMRTVVMPYEVLHNIYMSRQNHKLDEWRDFCKWIETLPLSELITLEEPV